MIWGKVKKLVIPLIIVKFIIFLIFLFAGDMVTISRDISYSNNNQNEIGIDSIEVERQKFIRIVRNEEESGILIVLRGKKNKNVHVEKEVEILGPRID